MKDKLSEEDIKRLKDKKEAIERGKKKHLDKVKSINDNKHILK